MSNHILALDIETTELDFKTGSIIEIGAIHFNGNERISVYSSKFSADPLKVTSLAALRVNKRSLRSLDKSQGLSNSAGLIRFSEWLLAKVIPVVGNKTLQILGHNVNFDAVWLKHALAAIGIVGWNEIFISSVKDTSIIGQFLRDTEVIKLDKMSLGNLARALHIEVDEIKTHAALYDAELSAKCYFAMLKLMKDLKNG